MTLWIYELFAAIVVLICGCFVFNYLHLICWVWYSMDLVFGFCGCGWYYIVFIAGTFYLGFGSLCSSFDFGCMLRGVSV